MDLTIKAPQNTIIQYMLSYSNIQIFASDQNTLKVKIVNLYNSIRLKMDGLKTHLLKQKKVTKNKVLELNDNKTT